MCIRFTNIIICFSGQGLSCNNVVQGLHITGNANRHTNVLSKLCVDIEGNPGSMDSHGFLRVSDEEWPLDASHTTEKILCDFEMVYSCL